MENHEERLAVIFKDSEDHTNYSFKTVALVDYDKDNDKFAVLNGEFEKSNEKAFNFIKGKEDFIYGNFNELKVQDNNADYSIYIFNNDFIEKIEEDKKIDKINAYVYIGKKLSKIRLKENANLLVANGSIVSLKSGEAVVEYGAADIYNMLYDVLKDKIYSNESEEEQNYSEEIAFEDEKVNIPSIIEKISNKIVGQEKAISTLVTNIYYNQLLIDKVIESDNFSMAEIDSRKVSILLDGETGTGKTAMLKEIAGEFSIPMEIVNANSFSETGYVGPTITDILANLLRQTGGDVGIAQRGIVVLDEIDKIASDKTYSGKDMKQGVQEELLSFISGGLYDVSLDFFSEPISFNTSALTFILSGAFTGIKDKKVNELKSRTIGFSNDENKDKSTYEVTPQDYIDYGLMREFFGRIKVITTTNSYSKEDLKKILLSSEISPLRNFIKTAEMFGYEKVSYTDEFLNSIVEEAYKMKTGARSLQTIMSEIQNELLLDLINGDLNKEEPIVLTQELLEKPKKQRVRTI